jgi:hypothetical protein
VTSISAVPPAGARFLQVGRAFLSPTIDLLVLGGGLSILMVAFLAWGTYGHSPAAAAFFAAFGVSLPWILLLCNSAHFAASTVRLYAKPGAFKEFRFLTMALPLLTVAAAGVAIAYGSYLGRHLYALYLTWSPYHYAAQAYGLAVMYCFRSGCVLDSRGRALLRASCLLPFLHAFFASPGVGLEWFVPLTTLETPGVLAVRKLLVTVLAWGSFMLPAVAFARIAAGGRSAVPLISVLVVLSNALWWITLNFMNAFVVATVFHAVQYLAIATIFHIRDQVAAPGNRHGPVWHAATFYAMSAVLGYLLFNVWPYAFAAAGFGLLESTLLVIAVVNIHHFVVDAYIWRLRRSASVRAAVAI